MIDRSALQGPTPYETWVRTLDAWSVDPMTPLDHLPPLTDDTYTPRTYLRLLEYIQAALQAATDRWHGELQRAVASYRDPHELGRQLVQLRASLARRWQLSSHPSLPPAFRTAMMDATASAIRRNQREFEDGIRDALTRSALSRAGQEQVLRVVRENPFDRALDVHVSQEGRRQEMAPLPVVEHAAQSASRFGHRRLNNL